ncbi:aminomethyl-transferring glycine dehydrogenase [Longimicrobium sp.]|uniref:aminomethyl-transferring glycine dehydrogenase n=1 Tax=Longimicrobium sp. TaxID=2029185 RepID=UPI002E362F89|nr:aminomethyl-transferring glycine dehydrogenase [Longimicrobium sp.]HEX6040581.1 aminomethyl-transferring glycine dehydrogenase [Longimicrobium sp.]
MDRSALTHTDTFVRRHVGPDEVEIGRMLQALGYRSLDELVDATVPASIRLGRPLALGPERSEYELLRELRTMMSRNRVFRSYLGMGYHDCIVPPVIQRNILENPGWYTQYTPYQAEIAQGRLEALLNFQTAVVDLTGLPIANASLLDEGTAAAEAMAMAYGIGGSEQRNTFFVSQLCHPQTIDVVRTRAHARGIEVVVGDHDAFDFSAPIFGALLQYPASDGEVIDYRPFTQRAREEGIVVVAAADLLSLVLLTPPGEWGADMCVGTSQRFGVPMGFGGPHAAFFSCRDEYKRQIPGRIIGVSVDAQGNPALRMALQTREQHIRREKATSNICTAQVLLAVMAGMYAVYHGPTGLRRIAERVHTLAELLAAGAERLNYRVVHGAFFDTVRIDVGTRVGGILAAARDRGINLREYDETSICIALDESTGVEDVEEVLVALNRGSSLPFAVDELLDGLTSGIRDGFERSSDILTHPVFNSYHSETEMMRYIRKLESRDLSLTHSMIPLGSCTMKLNATVEMLPVTWAEVGRIHPFAPPEQVTGYLELFRTLEGALAEITGFDAVSLQPNAGSQGEFAGLLVIRDYHEGRGEGHRDVCLIPQSAHGTNPASAVMAGMKVVVVASTSEGNVDLDDLRRKAEQHANDLAALMITYPSTHGVFEEEIREICEIVHARGGQVYMDGANMNAQVGLCRPGDFGADVCHLNLHKTFCIPHGGGGPGMGPICVKAHLAPYLPGHPVIKVGGNEHGAVSAAPWGSPSILPISWVYINLMGGEGLTHATKVAILNANYIARRLDEHYPVLYRGANGTVAHECIVDMRPLKGSAGIEVEDIAKRLMDYGFHAPTVSFPVAGTMMIEPTESEALPELDRFIDAMIRIREEIREIEAGIADRQDNVLKNAPHTAAMVMADAWTHAYGREKAAFPAEWVRERKFWPHVARVNNAAGDRNLVCSCPPVDMYAQV